MMFDDVCLIQYPLLWVSLFLPDAYPLRNRVEPLGDHMLELSLWQISRGDLIAWRAQVHGTQATNLNDWVMRNLYDE